MLQRKVPQTLVYGVKQALARSQQQTKSVADGSDIIAVKDHVQSTTSPNNNLIINNNNNNKNNGTESTTQKFVSECSSGIQLSDNFSVVAISNVSDAIIQSIGIEKLIEIASATVELPKQESIPYYGSLDFSQEEFDMFISSQQQRQHQQKQKSGSSTSNDTRNYLKTKTLTLATRTSSSSSLAAPLSSSYINNNKNNKNNNNNNNNGDIDDATNIVSSKDSSVKFEELTSSTLGDKSLVEKLVHGLKVMVSELRRLFFGKQASDNSSNNGSRSSSDSDRNSNEKYCSKNSDERSSINELTALGVIFASAFAVDVLLIRMYPNALILSQMFKNSFRESLLKQYQF